ncbi:microsomal glutathione S-transferase 1-like [Helicoverpa armigera]|uniref:microsomal glutathione S-transferase 1-like n=1 Tax=Helicoverpa armigera TaxID=29058 RepID=UPI0021116792|nr:microsomal glutathione S-transferase 1-like [Helicoverpa armigera]
MVSLSLDNPLVQTYIFHSSILALNLLFAAFLTIRSRVKKSVFANPEDAAANKGKVKFDDEDVERARRAHLNALENIPLFWILGALYLTTGPVAAWATLLFRVYTLGRILHTLVYVVMPLPQPSRAIAYLIPVVITSYMGVQVALYYISAM